MIYVDVLSDFINQHVPIEAANAIYDLYLFKSHYNKMQYSVPSKAFDKQWPEIIDICCPISLKRIKPIHAGTQ